MTAKYFDWLSAKIDEHAKIQMVKQGYDYTALTRLADAAAALQNRGPGAQAFGMTLPAAGVERAEVLVDRCLRVIGERAALLEPDVRDQFGALLQRLNLKPVIAAPEEPQITHVLRVRLATSIEDAETEDEIHDVSILRRLNGVRESHGMSLVELPAIRSAVGKTLDPLEKDKSWARDGYAQLVFDSSVSAVHCELVFDLVRAPSQPQLDGLLDAIAGPLFEGSWVLNLEWDEAEGVAPFIVHLQQAIASHIVTPLEEIATPN